jgi:hypothetical protein
MRKIDLRAKSSSFTRHPFPKVRARLREFDGEEGLDAGMQIEGFAGPAGSDGLGVGMLEAVHRNQFITLGLQPPLREGEMVGEILIVHPRVAALLIGSVKHPTAWFAGDADPALMHHRVMPLAQQDQIIEVGSAAQNPRHHMMSLQMPSLMAAGILAHLVPDYECSALRLTDQPSAATQSQHRAVLVDDGAEHRVVAGMSLRGRGLD